MEADSAGWTKLNSKWLEGNTNDKQANPHPRALERRSTRCGGPTESWAERQAEHLATTTTPPPSPAGKGQPTGPQTRHMKPSSQWGGSPHSSVCRGRLSTEGEPQTPILRHSLKINSNKNIGNNAYIPRQEMEQFLPSETEWPQKRNLQPVTPSKQNVLVPI